MTRTFFRVALAALVLSFGCVHAGAQSSAADIAIGPYVQNVTQETARVCWATIKSESSITGADGKVKSNRVYDHHEMVMGNLEPNTTYTYDVLGTGEAAAKGKFTTLPEDPEPYMFISFGDTRSHHEVHQQVVNAVIEEDPRFVLVSGDLISDGMEINDWERFFSIERELMRNICVWPALGNHEHDSPHYFDFFSLPGNERYYHFTAGDVLFVVLDDQGYDNPMPSYLMDEAAQEAWWASWTGPNKMYMETQKAWLEHILTLNATAPYIIVTFHEPLISVKRTRVEDAKKRRAFWGDIWERHNVNMILNGHDHHYHRAVADGVQFVTSAGGGASLYDPDTPAPETVKVAKVHHYLKFEVDKGETKVTAIDLDGEVVDAFEMPQRAGSK
jgi:hypothetical protein